ncbi:MAG: glycosyltransferase family 4 protein [Limnochordales bacterium]|nr:glycosyltransferase family 4 protein [Limnochordales bacterium]
MNIWIINHYAVPPNCPGGTRHYSLAKYLVQRGHNVTIVASSFNHTTRREVHLNPGECYKLDTVGGVRFLWLRTPPYAGNTVARVRNMLSFSHRVYRLVSPQLLGKPDVILGSSPHLFAALAAERLAARYAVPFVFEVRDLWPQSLIDLGGFNQHHPFIAMLEGIERHLYRRATRIITLLPGACDHMQRKGAARSKVDWIPNGIDLDLIPAPTPPRRTDTLTVMYAGSHGLANGLEVVLEAAYLLQQNGWAQRIRFRLIGDGPEKPSLVRKSQELRLTNVSFEDPVPKQDIYKVLAEADAFLMVLKTSPLFRWGISPNKLFDYMVSARPVLFCVDTPFNIVEEARAGLSVSPGNPSELAKAAVRIAEMSYEERWEMGMRGRMYVENNDSFSVLADKLEHTLRQATS